MKSQHYNVNAYTGVATGSFEGICNCDVTVTTNCPQGGDAGHGGQTTIHFRPEGFSIECEMDSADDSVSLIIGGDAEAFMLPDMLRFAADSLEAMLSHRETVDQPLR